MLEHQFMEFMSGALLVVSELNHLVLKRRSFLAVLDPRFAEEEVVGLKAFLSSSL